MAAVDGGEATVRLPMQALQSAVAADMDARSDLNTARRHEAARLYEHAIEALEDALKREPRLSRLLPPSRPNVFSIDRCMRDS